MRRRHRKHKYSTWAIITAYLNDSQRNSIYRAWCENNKIRMLDSENFNVLPHFIKRALCVWFLVREVELWPNLDTGRLDNIKDLSVEQLTAMVNVCDGYAENAETDDHKYIETQIKNLLEIKLKNRMNTDSTENATLDSAPQAECAPAAAVVPAPVAPEAAPTTTKPSVAPRSRKTTPPDRFKRNDRLETLQFNIRVDGPGREPGHKNSWYSVNKTRKSTGEVKQLDMQHSDLTKYFGCPSFKYIPFTTSAVAAATPETSDAGKVAVGVASFYSGIPRARRVEVIVNLPKDKRNNLLNSVSPEIRDELMADLPIEILTEMVSDSL